MNDLQAIRHYVERLWDAPGVKAAMAVIIWLVRILFGPSAWGVLSPVVTLWVCDWLTGTAAAWSDPGQNRSRPAGLAGQMRGPTAYIYTFPRVNRRMDMPGPSRDRRMLHSFLRRAITSRCAAGVPLPGGTHPGTHVRRPGPSPGALFLPSPVPVSLRPSFFDPRGVYFLAASQFHRLQGNVGPRFKADPGGGRLAGR